VLTITIMAAKAIVAARMTTEKKQRFAAMAHNRGLSESSLLNKLIDGALVIAPPIDPITSQDVRPLPATGKVSVRLRPDDLMLLRERAKGRELPAGTYVSLLVRAHLRSLTPLPTAEFAALRQSLLQVAAIGRNLNQIARALNSGERDVGLRREDLFALVRALIGLRDHIHNLLESNSQSWEAGYEKAGHQSK
jgi:hypothetical protein